MAHGRPHPQARQRSALTWHIHYAGVRVGVIVERSGVANSAEPLGMALRLLPRRHAVRSGRWAYRIVAMLEAVTVFFGS
jgi:hypothetical protein